MADTKVSALTLITPTIDDTVYLVDDIAGTPSSKRAPLSSIQTLLGREKLTAARTYYVRTDGSDSNTGLTDSSGGAFLTIGKALTVAAALDCSTYNLTVQVRSGTYTENVVFPAMLGSGTFLLTGDTTTPANVIITSSSGTTVSATGNNVTWSISGFKITNSAIAGLVATEFATIRIAGKMEFGACAIIAIGATLNGMVDNAGNNYTISGNSTYILYSASGTIREANFTATISGTITVTYWALCTTGGRIQSTTHAYSGSLSSGGQYSVVGNAIISASGGAFPGTGTNEADGGEYF